MNGATRKLTRKFKTNENEGDPWVAQWFGACLWPRARSWRPGIESHIRLPAWSLILPLPITLPLCVSHEYINKGEATVENSLEGPQEIKNRGSLSGTVVWCLPLAQGVIPETRDRIPLRAPSACSLLLSLPVSLPLSLSRHPDGNQTPKDTQRHPSSGKCK